MQLVRCIMIIDFTVKNFRSFRGEHTLSMNAENGHSLHSDNYALIEAGKLAVLRSAAVLGPNASGKSNLLKAVHVIKWLINSSGNRKEGQSIPYYEPFKLSFEDRALPVEFEIEFVVPSGVRYRYSVAFNKLRILSESLYSFLNRQRALVFKRNPQDTWETVKFGGSYKGGSRRIPFFENNTYISKAGDDASAPENIREIFRYFRNIQIVDAQSRIKSTNYFDDSENLNMMSALLALADTGISEITAEENAVVKDMRFPEEVPDEIRQAFIDAHKLSFTFWSNDHDGKRVEFSEDEISDGTLKFFELMPTLLAAIAAGVPVFVDELDGHLHTNIVSLILEIFNDTEINKKNSQLIFTTHDTNVLDSSKMRRDQIWFVSKRDGETTLTCLDSYDKNYVRADSPFEKFYIDGRFEALPIIDKARIRRTLTRKSIEQPHLFGEG
jgi:uncharacterized protein